jgi:hypothetical protein
MLPENIPISQKLDNMTVAYIHPETHENLSGRPW